MTIKKYSHEHRPGESNPHDSKPNETLSSNHKRDKAGWISPVYSEAKAIQLDPKFIMENRIVGMSPDSPEINFYKILRTQIQHRTRSTVWLNSLAKVMAKLIVVSVLPSPGFTLVTMMVFQPFSLVRC